MKCASTLYGYRVNVKNVKRESSSVGRASAFQADGRRFEPDLSLKR